MAILFSQVMALSDEEKVDFMVGGIPREVSDLRGWNVFEDFLKTLKPDSKVVVFVTTYKYGEGEECDAKPYEVADFQQRLKIRPNFLESSCIKISYSDFKLVKEKTILDNLQFLEL